MKTISIDLYSFSELSAEVQKKVIEKYRDTRGGDFDCDMVHDILVESLREDHGVVADDVRFSLSSSQGDGVAFFGNLDLEVLCEKHPCLLPLVNELGGADSLTARIYSTSNHYCHYNTMRLELGGDGSDANDSILHKKIMEILVTASKSAEARGYEVLDSLRSDEALTEEIESSEVNFTVDGREWYTV